MIWDITGGTCPDCFRCGTRLEWPPHRMGICRKCQNNEVDLDTLEALEAAHRDSEDEFAQQAERDSWR
jgi:hypothetical protein